MAKKKKKSAFRGKVNRDVERQEAAQKGYGYLILPKNVSVYNPTAGKAEKIDILPYVRTSEYHPDKDDKYEVALKGDLWYKRPFKIHRNIGSNQETVICPTSFGKPCPVCEYRSKKAKEGADRDELQNYKTSDRNLYLIIPRGVSKYEETVHIMENSQYVFQGLLNDELKEDDEMEIFPDLEEGKTLKIRWAEKALGQNKFTEAKRIDFYDRKEAIDEEIIEGISLDNCLKELSYEELEKKFFEIDHSSSDENDDEDDDEMEETSKKSKSKKKENDLPFDDVEDDSDEDEDEETSNDLEWSDLKDMDINELIDVANDNDIDPDDYIDEDNDDKVNCTILRKAIAKELEIEIPKAKSEKNKASKEKSKNKCPFGHKWGEDTDKHDDCENCDKWNDCDDA